MVQGQITSDGDGEIRSISVRLLWLTKLCAIGLVETDVSLAAADAFPATGVNTRHLKHVVVTSNSPS